MNVSFFNYPGLVSEVLMRKKEMEIVANLKSIVVLDCDKDALYNKVQPASGRPSEMQRLASSGFASQLTVFILVLVANLFNLNLLSGVSSIS